MEDPHEKANKYFAKHLIYDLFQVISAVAKDSFSY